MARHHTRQEFSGYMGAPFLQLKALPNSIEVLHRTIHPPSARGMRIGQGIVPRRLLAHVLAPHLAEGKKEALRRRVAIDLGAAWPASLAKVSIKAM